MIKNIIFGKNSQLSQFLKKKIKNNEVISINDFDKKNINKEKNKINLIFNNFYPSYKLNKINCDDYQLFIKKSIIDLGKVLSQIDSKIINKVIYTSSSSVYSLAENLSEIEDKYNRKLYSGFKYAAEKLVANFCKKKKIRFYIMRVFNIYGNSLDEFSFIEKLIRIKKNNKKIHLINKGISERDFIHIDDVVSIYEKFLINDYKSGIFDIGTGKGVKIRDLIDYLSFKKDNIIKLNKVFEINKSVADIKKLTQNIGNFTFNSLEKYIQRRLKLKNKKKLNYQYKLNVHPNYIGSAIYGAGFAGIKLYHKLSIQKEKIVLFIDDDVSKQNSSYKNIPILSFRDLISINKKTPIDRIFVAIPSLKKDKLKVLNNKLAKNFFDVRHLPEKNDLISDNIDINDLKINKINSILKKKPILRKSIPHLKNKNVLVTGAAGSIGFEILRQLGQQKTRKIIGVDNSEINIYEKRNLLPKKTRLFLLDINDKDSFENLIKKNKIDLIIHAAAYKHLNILEENIFAAVKNNIFGTENVCEAANKYKINLTLISTDKAADPISILGITKKICENIVHYYCLINTNKNIFNIVRFGNVFGSSGSAITKFIDQINKDIPVTITNTKATRYFMTTMEACHLVLKTISLNLRNKIFVLNMGKPINIFKIAKKISSFKKKIDPFYKFKYIETGLGKNEKLHEVLFEKKEKYKIINKDIFYIDRKNIDLDKFISCFEKLKYYFKISDKIKLKNTLNKMIKI